MFSFQSEKAGQLESPQRASIFTMVAVPEIFKIFYVKYDSDLIQNIITSLLWPDFVPT